VVVGGVLFVGGLLATLSAGFRGACLGSSCANSDQNGLEAAGITMMVAGGGGLVAGPTLWWDPLRYSEAKDLAASYDRRLRAVEGLPPVPNPPVPESSKDHARDRPSTHSFDESKPWQF
jgi:hypothetical protein